MTGAGAVSFSLTPEGDRAPFHANNVLYHVQKQDNGFTGDLMMSKFPVQYLVDTLGWVFDANGMLVEAENVPQKPHALLFEVMGTNSPIRVVLYHCVGSKPVRAYRANEAAPRFEGETMALTITPFHFGWVTTAKSSLVREENPTAYDSFFDNVMLPVNPLAGGGKVIPIRATVVARMYFLQEFGEDLREALKIIFDKTQTDASILGAVMRVIWAAHKAENTAALKSTPNFKQWLAQNKDFEAADCLQPFMDEVLSGFLIRKDEDEAEDSAEDKDITHRLVTVAKRVGFSISELNDMTTQGLCDMLQIFAGQDDDDGAEATPEQIEAVWR